MDIIPIVVIPIVRNVAGFLENALKDNKIDNYEWKQLAGTVLRVGMIGLMTYFGLNGLGVDIDTLGASASAVILDFFISAIKKK